VLELAGSSAQQLQEKAMGCLFASRPGTPNRFRPALAGIAFVISLGFAPRAHAVPVDLGDVFSIDILLGENITDLFVYQFSVSYDPTILSANSVSEGSFLSSAGTTFFIPGIINNALGLITFSANTLIGAIPGASGMGSLLSIQFTAIALGTSAVSPFLDPDPFVGDVLLDSLFNPITADLVGETVEVRQPVSSVPEPGALLLVGVGAVALASRRRARC
jgi:hypothetical protein